MGARPGEHWERDPMSTQRFGRMQKATALVPLALLSAAWTASLAGVGAAPAVVAGRGAATPRCPTAAASRPRPSRPPPACPIPARSRPASDGNAEQIVATASTNGIPSAALAAYQRAETVINAADKSCNLDLAAGRRDRPGRVQPRPLRRQRPRRRRRRPARHLRHRARRHQQHRRRSATPTPASSTTTRVYDRAVGPMQFIPSTWSVVGVDADGDGQRNPQDIDDAALATAVYLCSGDDDLSTDAGPARRGLPLQPLPGLRRPGAVDHGRLPRRRLHRRCPTAPPPPATSCPSRRRPATRQRQQRRPRQQRRRLRRSTPAPAAPTSPVDGDDGGDRRRRRRQRRRQRRRRRRRRRRRQPDLPAGRRSRRCPRTERRPGRRRADPGPGHRPVHPRRRSASSTCQAVRTQCIKDYTDG